MTRLALTIRGVVQGVGLRPFVRRAALRHGLSGWVRNTRDGVRLHVQGSEADLEAFIAQLTEYPPAASRIQQLTQRTIAEEAAQPFTILDSDANAAVTSSLPADLRPCDDCLRELRDPTDRRYRYPFINCTQCGPRLSIVESLPYDRKRTTMRHFSLCADCAREHGDVNDRRYHAQPLACPACGPQLMLTTTSGERLHGDAALRTAVKRLADGAIITLRGVGGYQLLVDAGDEAAVRRLRARKLRPHKPLAVMFASLEQLRRYATPNAAEVELLAGAAAPIVLLDARRCEGLAQAVSPGSPWVGAMLPSSPLHQLLLDDVGRPLVCTSGNLHGQPICFSSEQAQQQLASVADLFLDHDRGIARPLDDSLARVATSQTQLLRRARGHAPLAVATVPDDGSVLALGAHLKITVALSHRGQLTVSQHLCDLSSPQAHDLLEATVDDICAFYDAVPDAIACDLHPNYASTTLARRLAQRQQLPLIQVQHHHAHVAAVMAEHELQGPVLGLAFDGTGLGSDGSIWGGEALLCNGGDMTRFAHLQPFPLPGGERAMRSPRRAALGLLAATLPAELGRLEERFQDTEYRVLRQALERRLNSPPCSSMGRLFDAVAALLGLADECSFEGQAALALEASARRCCEAVQPYPVVLDDGVQAPWSVALTPLVAALMRDLDAGIATTTMALRFHLAVAQLGATIAARAGVATVALSGGCFVNSVLFEQTSQRLRAAGHEVYAGEQVPPGDGGISVGQVWVAQQRLRANQRAAQQESSHVPRDTR